MRTSILLVLFFCCVSAKSYGEDSFPFLAEITADRVILRAGQSENFENLGLFNKGQEVVAVDKNYSWYKVKLPEDVKCFVSNEYIEIGPGDIGTVQADRLNIRAGPDINFTILGQLNKGDRVQVREKQEKWFQIVPVEQSFGWIHEEYIVFKSKDVPPPRVVQEPIRNIYLKKKLEEQASQEGLQDSQAPIESSEPEGVPADIPPDQEETPDLPAVGSVFTAVGMLDPLASPVAGIDYQLNVNETTVYYLEAYKGILDTFSRNKVKVEGKLKEGDGAQQEHPVLIVSKISLVM